MSEKTNRPTIQNRKARFDFHIDKSFEAGMVLQGTEVKSLRQGNANFTDAFAIIQDDEVWLREFYIKPYDHQGLVMNHDPRRPRKLLLNKKEIRELDRKVQQKGYTIVPLKLFFKGQYAKVEIGLARGKKNFDKRDSIKDKDAKRDMDRRIKGNAKINL